MPALRSSANSRRRRAKSALIVPTSDTDTPKNTSTVKPQEKTFTISVIALRCAAHWDVVE